MIPSKGVDFPTHHRLNHHLRPLHLPSTCSSTNFFQLFTITPQTPKLTQLTTYSFFNCDFFFFFFSFFFFFFFFLFIFFFFSFFFFSGIPGEIQLNDLMISFFYKFWNNNKNNRKRRKEEEEEEEENDELDFPSIKSALTTATPCSCSSSYSSCSCPCYSSCSCSCSCSCFLHSFFLFFYPRFPL